MRTFVIVAVAVVIGGLCQQDAHAWPRYRNSNSNSNYTTQSSSTPKVTSYTNSYGANDTSSAQGVAEIMARTGRVGHWGGNRGYEGCGSGSSQEAAYRNCCFSNSGMTTVDVGYAQGSNGQWYCCRRYR
jgi:hypothetical protein